MGAPIWLLLLLLHSAYAGPVDSEADLPPYLRGIEWRNVEKELSKDLRLNSAVRPISYEIDLSIAAKLVSGASVQDLAEIKYNRERETVIFPLPTPTFSIDDRVIEIQYRGTATMRAYGLYESWTDDEAKQSAPSISVVTFSEPTGARRWFPCFDDPDKKAKFRIRLTHPEELIAYSNTAGETKKLDDSISETLFSTTPILPTYVVALALTKQPAYQVEHRGQKISAIGLQRFDIAMNLKNSIDYVRNQAAFKNVTFIAEKTDWLIVEDFFAGAMENPGLIMSKLESSGAVTQIHELAHMYFGNLVTLRSWEQIWINEGFARFYQEEYFQQMTGNYEPSPNLMRASILDVPMHQQFGYARSQFIFNHFIRNAEIHYSKAAQVIRMIRRYIGIEAFDRALNKYLIANSFGNGDSEMMIGYLSEENFNAREILIDWVYQPGVALLSVEEENRQVTIRQRRVLRTDFMEEMRDTTTRWTIPLFYTINGAEHIEVFHRAAESLNIAVPVNSTFAIDESYPMLYQVHYTNRNASIPGSLSDEYAMYKKYLNVSSLTRGTFGGDKGWESQLPCNTRNQSTDEMWRQYILKKDTKYLFCDGSLETKENAKEYLRKLLVANNLPVRNGDLQNFASEINTVHPGVLIEFFVEEFANIDFLDFGVWNSILVAMLVEERGFETLRNVVRSNPSFAANFYNYFTRAFEEEFMMNQLQKMFGGTLY